MAAVLAADIGGTTTRLAIVKDGKIVAKERIATESVTDLAKIVKRFLSQHSSQKVAKGYFAVACPIAEGKIHLTNGSLTISEAALRKSGLRNVVLLNDVEATGYAIGRMAPRMRLLLRKGKRKGGALAVVAPGTGLGQCILLPKKGGDEVIPSEGGHCDVPLHTAEEFGLAAYVNEELGRETGAPVSYEELLSGEGLRRIYRFLLMTKHQQRSAFLRRSAEEIAQGEDACSKEAWQFFERLLGRRCRNLVLEAYATGGLYLTGGLVIKNSARIGKAFLDEFENHGHPRYRRLLQEIPITIITDEDATLLGAASAK